MREPACEPATKRRGRACAHRPFLARRLMNVGEARRFTSGRKSSGSSSSSSRRWLEPQAGVNHPLADITSRNRSKLPSAPLQPFAFAPGKGLGQRDQETGLRTSLSQPGERRPKTRARRSPIHRLAPHKASARRLLPCLPSLLRSSSSSRLFLRDTRSARMNQPESA